MVVGLAAASACGGSDADDLFVTAEGQAGAGGGGAAADAGGAGAGAETSSVSTCEDGATASCQCDTGDNGIQTCVGGEFGPCYCAVRGDGGTGTGTGTGSGTGSQPLPALTCSEADLSQCAPPSSFTACCTGGGACGYVVSGSTCARFVPTDQMDTTCHSAELSTAGCCMPDGTCGVFDASLGGCSDPPQGAGTLGVCGGTATGADAGGPVTVGPNACPSETLFLALVAVPMPGCCLPDGRCGLITDSSNGNTTCTAREELALTGLGFSNLAPIGCG